MGRSVPDQDIFSESFTPEPKKVRASTRSRARKKSAPVKISDEERQRRGGRTPSQRQGCRPPDHDGRVKTITLDCADNVKKTVTPGVPDYESEYAYRSGQCLALAVTLAEAMEDSSVALFMRTDGGLYHAAAFDEKTERYIDYRGWWDADEFEEYHSFDEGNSEEGYCGAAGVKYLDAAEAREYEPYITLLPRQNYRVAATFVPDVLAGSVSFDHSLNTVGLR